MALQLDSAAHLRLAFALLQPGELLLAHLLCEESNGTELIYRIADLGLTYCMLHLASSPRAYSLPSHGVPQM